MSPAKIPNKELVYCNDFIESCCIFMSHYYQSASKALNAIEKVIMHVESAIGPKYHNHE